MKSNTTQKTHLTVPEIAAQWRCNVDKVRRFIETGELRGINIAQSLNTRPRYRVKVEDVAAFEDRRAAASVTAPKVSRVRRASARDVPSVF